MIQFRKLIIGMVSVFVVVITFVIYTNRGSSTEIVQTPNDRVDTLKRPDFTNSQKFGDSVIGEVDNAEFITRDLVTKEVTRIFGFEKMLNPEKNSEKMRLRKPYMEFFGDDHVCKITSDEGNFRIEKVMNEISPQTARLYGHVEIEIKFEDKGVPTTGTIYLEDLDYDSEKSAMATDKSVVAVFDNAVMEGTGMLLIYNSAKSRIEYFEIKDLDFIKIKDIAKMSKDRKEKPGNQSNVPAATDTPKANTNQKTEVAVAEKTDTSIVAKTTLKDAPKTAAVAKDAPESTATMLEKAVDYYHCRFLKDVKIHYGQELVVKSYEELNIKNLLFSQAQSKQQPKQSSTKQPAPAKPVESTKPVVSNEPVEGTEPVAAAKPVKSEKPYEPTEVILTCRQGFVVQLMSNMKSNNSRKKLVLASQPSTMANILAEIENKKLEDISSNQNLISVIPAVEMSEFPLDVEYENFASDAGVNDLEGVIVAEPTRFFAQKIDYNMTSNYAYATGPVKLLIYGKPDPNGGPDQEQIPLKITAKDNTEYFAIRDQIVFNGQVEGIRQTTSGEFVTENSVHGDQLIADLDSGTGENSISHISVLGKDVMLFSTRKAEEKVLSLVRLKCMRIDHDATEEFVLATGPGKIEINNSNVPVAEPSGDAPKKASETGATLKEPCYAWIDHFDSLKWNTVTNKVIADGKTDSLEIVYIPIIDKKTGKFGKSIYTAARNIEANFRTTELGRTELLDLTASDTVSFQERYSKDDVINTFIGDKLFYNAEQSQMLITGTKDNPCLANGVSADKINYNMVTGALVTKISGVSTIQLPPNPKR
jgi:hypothetical protein